MSKKLIEPKKPTGFIDYLPGDQIAFNNIVEKIKTGFELFGFLPLDTPVAEYSEVINAKAGGETDKQVFNFQKGDNELSLRVDLTIPLARYVAENYNKLTFPFRRYQIGKVYRGEKPQKGRFREFYQCDIDIIDNKDLSLSNDAEVPAIIFKIFKSLDIGDFVIKINNRKILQGYLEYLNLGNQNKEILKIIDKLYQIGADEVKKELKELKIEDKYLDKLINLITLNGTNTQIIEQLNNMKDVENTTFSLGVEELTILCTYLNYYGLPQNAFQVDLAIVRGLDYYTGTVYETFLKDNISWGSVCSGGRYDDLAGFYTEQKLPGVGISIGLTRLFSLLKESGRIITDKKAVSKVLVIPLTTDFKKAIECANYLRNIDIPTEIYNEQTADLRKKLGYAKDLNINYVILIGEDEIRDNILTLKDMSKGKQEKYKLDTIAEQIL